MAKQFNFSIEKYFTPKTKKLKKKILPILKEFQENFSKNEKNKDLLELAEFYIDDYYPEAFESEHVDLYIIKVLEHFKYDEDELVVALGIDKIFDEDYEEEEINHENS